MKVGKAMQRNCNSKMKFNRTLQIIQTFLRLVLFQETYLNAGETECVRARQYFGPIHEKIILDEAYATS